MDRLLLFGKRPVAGMVKTRLVPPLRAQQAADLYTAFLLDAVESALRLSDVSVTLYIAGGASDVGLLRQVIDAELECAARLDIRLQRGTTLGERLYGAFCEAFDEGGERVCVLGTDHPSLPSKYVLDAFAALQHEDMVIGPADDGGYYLLGMRCNHPWAFEGLPFSTPRLLDATIDAAAAHAVRPVLLPRWYDVDDAATLDRLWDDRELLNDDSRTRRALDRLMGSETDPSTVRGGR